MFKQHDVVKGLSQAASSWFFSPHQNLSSITELSHLLRPDTSAVSGNNFRIVYFRVRNTKA